VAAFVAKPFALRIGIPALWAKDLFAEGSTTVPAEFGSFTIFLTTVWAFHEG
jgi:hypothetical protein